MLVCFISLFCFVLNALTALCGIFFFQNDKVSFNQFIKTKYKVLKIRLVTQVYLLQGRQSVPPYIVVELPYKLIHITVMTENALTRVSETKLCTIPFY